jgi:hypothetical protein
MGHGTLGMGGVICFVLIIVMDFGIDTNTCNAVNKCKCFSDGDTIAKA